MRKSVTYVSLTGGLGNQLFELAAGINTSNGGQIILLSEYGKPRLAFNGLPEIMQFVLPGYVSFESGNRKELITAKALGYALRINLKGNRIELSSVFRFLIRFLAEALIAMKFKKWIKLVICRGVGFCKLTTFHSQFLLGYFQSWRWAQEPATFATLMQLRCKSEGSELKALINSAKKNPPLIVHIRLTDYRNEPEFGIPAIEYYLRAIEESQKKNYQSEIWVFSDEIENCEAYIPSKYHHITRWIRAVDNSDSATLEAMRLGKCYVIGNSTFGYWSALLSRQNPERITSPLPWFKGMPEPIDLVPNNWIRLDARYDLPN